MTVPHSSRDADKPDATVAWRDCLREWAAARDYPALLRISRRAEAIAADPDIQARLTPVRIALLSSATADFLLPILKAALYRVGLRPSLHVAPYGQVTTSLLEPAGPLVEFRPQVTLVLHATLHMAGWPALTASIQDAEARAREVCRSLLDPCAVFHERTGTELVLDNFHSLSGRAAGNFGAKLPGDPNTFIRRVNLTLGDHAPSYVHLNDVASLAERRGIDTWVDERYWHLAKQPVSFDCVADYCRSLAAVVGAVLGRTKKCLILDLDNTLWGGVIGDDGLAGIEIGEGGAEGEAYKAFQRYARELRERGVLLAVCSKNDEATAKSAFTDHPDMVLTLDDFVVFKANWQPKSENIRAIAQEMDLPLESFVFVDDNPAERHEVRQALPEVTVPELPEDPAGFVRALDDERLFEVVALTREDLRRTSTYHARRQTLEALAGATDIPAYLASLEMSASVRPFELVSFDRITQLINKTNQFNLTTPRVVPADVVRLAGDPACVTCTVRLKDRFADHGLISVVYGQAREGRLEIDAWLMSCRVLGRGVEQLVFTHLVREARARGLDELLGFYQPTARNALVRNHYAALGFTRDGEADGRERWRLPLGHASSPAVYIVLEEAAPAGSTASS